MTTGFSRLVALTKIGPGGQTVIVQATEVECAVVAARMNIPAVLSLSCAFSLTPDEGTPEVIEATGHLRARLTRECIVSAEDFDTDVEDHFTVYFVPSGQESEEPDPDRDDEIPYENGMLDLADAAAEQLGLILDPYPRIQGAVVPETGDDADGSPFAALLRPEKGKE